MPDGFIYGALNTSNSLTYSNPSWNASGLPDVNPRRQFPVVVDSGTTLTLLPSAIVRDYARQLPRPVAQSDDGSYWALCDTARAGRLPRFGVTVGGRTLYFRDDDLLLQDVRQDGVVGGRTYTFCMLGLVDLLPEGPYILGDTFLNSVVSVFDVGASEMRFYPRT